MTKLTNYHSASSPQHHRRETCVGNGSGDYRRRGPEASWLTFHSGCSLVWRQRGDEEAWRDPVLPGFAALELDDDMRGCSPQFRLPELRAVLRSAMFVHLEQRLAVGPR